MENLLVYANEAIAARRRVYFDIRSDVDNVSPITGISSGQPQVSSDGASWTNTGVGTMTEIGNGRYYADLTQTLVLSPGTLIRTRFKQAGCLETPGTSVQVTGFDPAAIVYSAKVWMQDDNSGTNDRYVVIWFKNGAPIFSGITSPTIQVFKSSDGSDLVASTAMTQIASTGTYRYSEATNRLASGASYVIKVTATIDGATRTWAQPMGRDS